jgi:hypothetical protein
VRITGAAGVSWTLGPFADAGDARYWIERALTPPAGRPAPYAETVATLEAQLAGALPPTGLEAEVLR